MVCVELEVRADERSGAFSGVRSGDVAGWESREPGGSRRGNGVWTLTAGLYAGLQQKALGVRRRWLGDLAIVAGVPGLSQLVDWTVHKAMGAPIPHRALAIVCAFTLISALFHRHVMRRGGFLTGGSGHSLREDFRRIPQLVVSFVLWPGRALVRLRGRVAAVRWGHESA